MIKYQQAETEHIKGILEIEQLSFSTPWSEKSFQAEFADDLAYYAVALHEEFVVGYSGFWHIVDEAHITNVAVHPDFRRQGIGCHLVDALLRETVKRGIRDITLEVREDNEPAINLYHQFGFEEKGIRKNYYIKERKNALIMWKHI